LADKNGVAGNYSFIPREEIFDVTVMPKVRAPVVQGSWRLEDRQEQICLAAEEGSVPRLEVDTP